VSRAARGGRQERRGFAMPARPRHATVGVGPPRVEEQGRRAARRGRVRSGHAQQGPGRRHPAEPGLRARPPACRPPRTRTHVLPDAVAARPMLGPMAATRSPGAAPKCSASASTARAPRRRLCRANRMNGGHASASPVGQQDGDAIGDAHAEGHAGIVAYGDVSHAPVRRLRGNASWRRRVTTRVPCTCRRRTIDWGETLMAAATRCHPSPA